MENYKLNNLRWATRAENLKNREDGCSKRKDKYFKRIDPVTGETTIIYYKDLDTPEIERISSAVRSGSKRNGFIWERGNSFIDNYIARVGSPKDEDWKECPYLPGVFCNRNGLLKIDGKLTLGHNMNGYRRISVNRKIYLLHRLIYETFNGKIENESLVIDHINTVRDDNRLENLRLVTQSENMNNPTTLKKISKPVKQCLNACMSHLQNGAKRAERMTGYYFPASNYRRTCLWRWDRSIRIRINLSPSASRMMRRMVLSS